jgi:very-short-patch-repair endonuclease
MRKLTKQEFIDKVKPLHSIEYSYPDEYIHSRIKMTITCPIHGDFKQTPFQHMRGMGCPHCRIDKIKKYATYNNQEFIDKVNKTHNNKYTYKYVSETDKFIIAICPIHGEFTQSRKQHLIGHGCQLCKSSKGELKVKKFLEDNNIKFIPQHTFNDCLGIKNKLPFDFYLPEYNVLIEFDGKQHYCGWNNRIDSLNEIQETDAIKNKYCADNCIRLLRISYKEISLVDEKIKQFLI